MLTFDAPVQIGAVNRASAVSSYVGGKGQGAALALARWAPGCAVVAHFLGGNTGSFVEDQLGVAGVGQIVQKTAAPTRVCTTLVAAGQAGGGTELIDPSGKVADEELAGMLEQISEYCRSTSVGGIAMCGTSPPGAAELYAAVAKQLAAERAPLLLVDGHKQEARAVLETGRVDALKINADEALQLTGATTAEEAAERLLYADGAPLTRPTALLALTDGPRPARLFTKAGAAFTLRVPEVECINAIGAGDVCTAIFLHELVAAATAGQADDPAAAADAFAWGLAAASARCRHSLPTAFGRDEVVELHGKVRIERTC